MWNDTAWRQCSIIDVDVLRNYNPGLVRSISEDTAYLCAVSYDGDIVNDNMMLEPVVEFVGVKRVAFASPEYTHAKNPSLLHLQGRMEGETVVLEFKASPKFSLSKHNLIPAILPDKRFSFEENAKATLQSWLSFRYRRQELPQAFLARTLPLWAYLRKEGKKYAGCVTGYWLSYDPRHDERSPFVPYTFSLYIVYFDEGHDARKHAESLAFEIRERFPVWKRLVKESGEIEMNDCQAYSEDCFTLSDLKNCVHFDLEQISYRPAAQENLGQETRRES